MKTIFSLFVLLPGAALFGQQYPYFFTDTFHSNDLNSYWASVGAQSSYFQFTSNGLQNTDGYDEINALEYGGQIPGGANRYEIKSTLPSPYSYPGTYIQYLAVSNPNNLTSGFENWQYYSVSFQVIPDDPTPGACTAQVTVNRQVQVGSTAQATTMYSTQVACPNNTVVRAVYAGWPGQNPSIFVWVNNNMVAQAIDSQTPLSGTVAIGVIESCLISEVDLGVWDNVNPNPPDPSSISASAFTHRVDLQWAPATPGQNGMGIYGYAVFRTNTYDPNDQAHQTNLTWYQAGTTISDLTVAPGTQYYYYIEAIDFEMNASSQSTFSVNTPVNYINLTIATPPARIGIRPTGTYWGASNEQIDMMSGNLNWTQPILKAMGRGGSNFGLSLNYNSQIWRQDSGGIWNLGVDVGYGFGWRLLAGSITPYWSDSDTIDHYIFTDSTGADYTLGVNTNGIWTSAEGIYVSYNPAIQKLSFPDGTFWMMNCESDAGEADAGTLYPTVLEDTNGNQIIINYQFGIGSYSPNTSARITSIEDVRAVWYGSGDPYGYVTYQFTYDNQYVNYTAVLPHLVSISNRVNTSEAYSFTFAQNQSLYDPFVSGAAGTVALLQSVQNTAVLQTTQFSFGNGTGELTGVTLPLGGVLTWAYRPFTYAGGRTIREVQSRNLTPSSGVTYTYSIARDDATDSNNNVHYFTALTDPTGAQKQWFFQNGSVWWNVSV